MFWVWVGVVVGVVLAVAWWADHRTKRRHRGSIDPLMRSRDSGANDVMGKDYGALNDHRPIDPTGGHGPGVHFQ